MYYPQEPRKDTSGCGTTLVITRMIIAILLIPIGLIAGGILAVILTFFAFSVHPLLGVLVIAVGAGLLVAVGKWESRRIERERPRDE